MRQRGERREAKNYLWPLPNELLPSALFFHFHAVKALQAEVLIFRNNQSLRGGLKLETM
jgi:hypothetical protein